MYNKVSTDMNFAAREKEVLQFWKDNNIMERSFHLRDDAAEQFTFYDGPPTSNGRPHIGHVETRAIKDLFPRYQTMKGKSALRIAGWDTHGLPVELEVEKLLGINGKQQIEEYGIEPFIQKCKESVWKYLHEWEDMSDRVGFWADMKHPYVTYHDTYIESEWWSLKKIWEKGLLYLGHKVVPYCPRCGTGLSSHEVAQGYKTLKERSAVVRFKVKDEDAYFLAWTTTPWTLPSNVALCVNPSETYAKVKAIDGNVYYLAEALLDTVLSPLKDRHELREDAVIRLMPHGHKKPRDLDFLRNAVLLDLNARKLSVAEKCRDTCVHHERHILPLFERLNQALLAPEIGAAVDEGDVGAGLAQKQRVLQSRVAAAADGHILTRKEGPVAHGAIADAGAHKLLLAFHPEHAGLCTHGDNQSPALKLRTRLTRDGLDAVCLRAHGHGLVQLHLGALLHGLLEQLVAELGAGDGEKAGEVFDPGAPGDLPAEGVFLDDQHALSRAPGIGGGGQSRRAPADNEDIVQHKRFFLSKHCKYILRK